MLGQLPCLFAGVFTREFQQIRDLVKAESRHLRTPDELKSVHVAFAVATHAAGRALRLMQQAADPELAAPQSYSCKLALEAEYRLRHFWRRNPGVRSARPADVDSVGADHPKVQQLREWSLWSEGQVWVSPERRGTLTAVFKNQIDRLPREQAGVRPT